MVAAISSPAWRSLGALKYVVVPPRLALIAAPLTARTTRPLTSAQALAVPGVAAVVDGAMFDTCGGPRQRGETQAAFYRRVGCARPNWRALDRARGVDFPSTRPTEGVTLSISAAGVVTAAGGATTAPDAQVAFQLYPPLVRRGRAVDGINGGPNAETNWRAGVGVTAAGQIILAVGRMSMADLAAALVRAGAVEAGYTDGGGSGRVVTADGRREGSTENRPVAMWIAAVAPDAPAAPVAPPPPPAGAAPPTDAVVAREPDMVITPEEAAGPAGAVAKAVGVVAALAAGAVAVKKWRAR